MGSFNETCALSNLNISYKTPVRLLFLTQNPYVVSDQHEGHRGCYHYDQWFVRTPPIKATYADYGQCDFQENPITDLIDKCFQKDVIERPFGFNQYHSCDVTKTKGIYHFLQAAWQGRLLVEDRVFEELNPNEIVPEKWPTWQKVHAILKQAKLQLQLESTKSEGCPGYNAQPVIPGVVCVTFNSYGNNIDKLKEAAEVLSKTFACKIIYKFKDKPNDPCLMVVPKGAFKNPDLLHDKASTVETITTHPELEHECRRLPVLAVMVREDVWQAYCCVGGEETVESILESFHKVYNGINKEDDIISKYHLTISEMSFREMLVFIPFQTTPSTHLVSAGKDFSAKDELLLGCAELSRVEYVMARTHQPWYIPPLGGQDGEWKLKTELLSKIRAISQKEWKDEKNSV